MPSIMEKESLPHSLRKAERLLQCPVCSGTTHVTNSHRCRRSTNILMQPYHCLFNQRVCRYCGFTFSALKIADSLRSLCQPLLARIFPYNEIGHAENLPNSLRTEEAPCATKKAKRRRKRRTKTTLVEGSVPFSIDANNRVITLNMQCALGDGDIGDAVKAAALILETNLRATANQIRAAFNSDTLASIEDSCDLFQDNKCAEKTNNCSRQRVTHSLMR